MADPTSPRAKALAGFTGGVLLKIRQVVRHVIVKRSLVGKNISSPVTFVM
jgi:hypothetical protein